VGLAIVVACLLTFVRWRALRVLRGSQEQLTSEQNFRVSVRRLQAEPSSFEWISAPAAFSSAAVYRGRLYLSGPAGLFEYDASGALLKHYQPGRDLPPSPLGRMAVAAIADSAQPELLIATADQGVLAFDGIVFRQILAEDPQARVTTAILPLTSGQLLLGTQKKGVLVYDGKGLRLFHPALANLHVTDIAGSEADLWIGTLDRGVVHWHGGVAEQFGEAQGMPDQQVHAISLAGDAAYVGTSVGVAEFISGKFARVLANGVFARTLHFSGNTLLVGSLDEGLIELPLGRTRQAPGRSAQSADLGEVQQISEIEGTLYAVVGDGLYSRPKQGPGWRRVLERQAPLLTDRNVSALAVDSTGRVWVGYFDRGLDLLDAGGHKVSHVEDEHVFCVNRIQPDPRRGMTMVATANGLVLFDALGHKQQVLGRNDGLIANHVTDVVAYRGGMAVATPAGLTFIDRGGPRSLYAFHGLVNNHVYALAMAGTRLIAGTLGGVSVLDDENVSANYTTSTSALKHNWITAVAQVGSDWFVGTYGAGIMRLDSSGNFHSFDVATGSFDVNPNAMLMTDSHVLAGTLGSGLYVYNRESGRWRVVTPGLPSANVTALAASGGFVYVGTDNGLVRIAEQNLEQ
jgi:ligand-binding sensor domain-containing protein